MIKPKFNQRNDWIMANKLDEYDVNKLKEAKKLIFEVYEYNYMPSTSLSKRLDTVLRKLDSIINARQAAMKM